MPDTPQDSRAELNAYGVPLWLLEALKAYDPIMTDESRRRDTVRTMKAKRRLAVAIQAYVAEQVATVKIERWNRGFATGRRDMINGMRALLEETGIPAILELLDKKEKELADFEAKQLTPPTTDKPEGGTNDTSN